MSAQQAKTFAILLPPHKKADTMGLWDYIRSFWGPPTRDRFAKIFIKEAKRICPDLSFVYDKANFSIKYDKDGVIYLTNIYLEHLQLPKESQFDCIKTFASSILLTRNFEIPTDFADVHPDLLPVVRSRSYFESIRLQGAIEAKDANHIDFAPYQPVCGNLVIALVYDLPGTMQTISIDQLKTWGVTFYEALEAARDNLRQMGQVQIAKIGEGTYVSCSGDCYDASRMLLDTLLDQFEVDGDMILMAPNRDLLIATGSKDAAGLDSMISLAFQSLEQPRPISTFAFCREEGELSVWLPDPSSPHYKPFKELQSHSIGPEHEEQKELLQKLFEACDIDIHVASLNFLTSETKAPLSYAIWSKGILTLLPEADLIALATFQAPTSTTSESDPEVEETFLVPWSLVTEHCSHLLIPTDYYPPRWKVESFPDEETLEKLRKHQVHF